MMLFHMCFVFIYLYNVKIHNPHISNILFWVGLHEVPHDLQTVDIVEGEEGVVVAVVAAAADHLVAAVAAAPAPTRPALHPVHVGGVGGAGLLAVHRPPHLGQVALLDVVVETLHGQGRVVRSCSKCAVYSRDKTNQNQNILITRAEIVRALGRHGDGGVEAAVEVDDADGRVRGGVVSPQRRAAHRARAGHAPRQPLHHPGPDEHPAIRHPWVSARACNELSQCPDKAPTMASSLLKGHW